MTRPFLSVILATRLRNRQLRRCLESLVKQTYSSKQWELIIVHDGEDVESEKVVAEFESELPVRSLRRPHAGCGMARNTGAAEALGEYLLFTDDDCVLPPDWLHCFDAAFRRNPESLIAGASRNWLPSNPYSQATQDITDYLLLHLNASPDNAGLALGNNMGVPAAAFLELQGFSARYYRTAAEDRDFCARWLAAGRRILYDRHVLVLHAHELNLWSFLRQHYHYGYGSFLFHQMQARQQHRSFRIERPGFYVSLLLFPRSAVVTLLVLVSQAAQTAGTIGAYLGIGSGFQA